MATHNVPFSHLFFIYPGTFPLARLQAADILAIYRRREGRADGTWCREPPRAAAAAAARRTPGRAAGTAAGRAGDQGPDARPARGGRRHRLGLDLESTLRRIVETAVGLVDATYGALGVIGEGKRLAEFIPVGLTQDEIARIHHWPEGRGLLGLLIDDPRPLRLADMAAHPESSGFPDGHPPMRGFLGVPVRVRDEVFGNLYLTDKRGGGEFTEDDEAVLVALGAAAGVAVENARLYEAARRQQRWIQASAEVTTRLLSGAEPGEVLADVTRQARELSGADLAVLALPDEDGRRLTITYADGDGADATRGLVLPAAESLSGRVLATGEPVTSADFADDERAAAAARGAMSQIGPAIVFPLGAPGNVRGVLTVGRRHGALPFPQAQADVVASFAAQAGVALELAASRAEAERLSLYEDRDRIARDLHDLVIQRLYATGMSLEGTMPMITRPEVASRDHERGGRDGRDHQGHPRHDLRAAGP